MKIRIGLQHYILFGLLLLVLSTLVRSIPVVQFIIGVFLLDLLANAYGQIFAPQAKLIYRWLIGFIASIALLIIGGALLIYLLEITYLSLAALWFLLFLIPVYVWRRQNTIIEIEINKIQIKFTSFILPLIILAIGTILLIIFNQAASVSVIFSIWSLLNNAWLYLYLLLIIALLFYLYKSRSQAWLGAMAIFVFLTVGLGVLVYKLGFGFDYHIHTATTEYIWNNGTISPKPLYYIGYYSLLINIKYILGISLAWLNKFIVPILLAFFVPGIIYHSLDTSFDFKKAIFKYSPLVLLLIPFTGYTLSTPQSFANILFIITIALSLLYLFKHSISLKLLWLIAIATCFVHPITGVPTLLIVLLISLRKWRSENYIVSQKRNIIFYIISITSVFTLPLLFFINSIINNYKISWQLPSLNLNLPNYTNFVSIYDFIYNCAWLLPWLIILLTIIGIVHIIRVKRIQQFSEYIILLIVLILNYLWLKFFISFDWLIDYEKLNYANRILDLIFIAALPFIFVSFGMLIEKILSLKLNLKLIAVLLLTILLTISFYLSYPRRDPYVHNKSLNTSITDIKIVNEIDTQLDEYVVLTNQAVSAAAISEFGFANYYNGLFYYPLPTSGILYQLYLDLAYQRQAIDKVINKVRSLTNMNNIVVVINSYWENSDSLINAHKKAARYRRQIDDAFIFYYTLAETDSQ